MLWVLKHKITLQENTEDKIKKDQVNFHTDTHCRYYNVDASPNEGTISEGNLDPGWTVVQSKKNTYKRSPKYEGKILYKKAAK